MFYVFRIDTDRETSLSNIKDFAKGLYLCPICYFENPVYTDMRLLKKVTRFNV